MSSHDALGLSQRTGDLLVRALQLVLAGIFVVGVLHGESTVMINAGGALLVTFVPAFVDWDAHVTMDSGLVLWLTVAALFHAAGTLGPYHWWWWDRVAHALTASVVAAAGYAVARALDVENRHLRLPAALLFCYLLLFTMTVGMLWELFEFGVRYLAHVAGIAPPLVQQSVVDTLKDLFFDGVGGVVVAAVATAYLERGRSPTLVEDGNSSADD